MFTGFNRFELDIDYEDAAKAYHTGQCDEDVDRLARKEYISVQLRLIDQKRIAEELKEHGAWSDEELQDESENKLRILWIACGNIVEEYVDRYERLRDIAYDWHGGQWSPLYAFASSGIVEDIDSLVLDINSALQEASEDDKADLLELINYVTEELETDDERIHYAAWATKPRQD